MTLEGQVTGHANILQGRTVEFKVFTKPQFLRAYNFSSLQSCDRLSITILQRAREFSSVRDSKATMYKLDIYKRFKSTIMRKNLVRQQMQKVGCPLNLQGTTCRDYLVMCGYLDYWWITERTEEAPALRPASDGTTGGLQDVKCLIGEEKRQTDRDKTIRLFWISDKWQKN